jgi:hypothetical protein
MVEGVSEGQGDRHGRLSDDLGPEDPDSAVPVEGRPGDHG